MATVTRRKAAAKGGAKTAAKSSTAKNSSKASAAKESTAKAAPKGESSRRTAEDVDKLVPQFLKRIESGATMRALKQEFGFSDDGPIRAALYRAGYDRKGNEHGETGGSIDATKAAGKKQLVKLRNDEGAAWYRLAFLAGIGEAEVKKVVTEAGGSEGRVYVKSEKEAAESGR
jgi:hypothetical protein